MPLTSLPDQGIEVPLSEYNRLRAFQGGGWFWDHDNQQVIREVLGDFLPRVEDRRDRGGALFQHFVGGAEVASRSQAVGAQMNRVPRSEYQRLQRALENLKRKAQDPHTDPNARKVIEKFCLPDPAKDPDLYRLHGSGWNRRLLVLWGCEREEGTSLAPVAALQRIAVESPGTTFLRRLPMLLLWLLLLLLVGAAFWWWLQRPVSRPDHQATANPSPATMAMDPSSAPAGLPGDTTVAPTGQGVASSGSDATGSTGASSNDAAKRAADADSSGTSAARSDQTRNASRQDSTAATAASGTDKSTRDLAASSLNDDRSKSTTAKSAAQEKSAADSAQGEHAATAADQGRTANDARSADAARAGAASSPPAANAATRVGESPTAATAGTTPALPAAPPKVEILKAQGATTPHDGKMDVVIMATAHESDGTLTPLEITRWSVDDSPQQDRAGRDVTSGQLNLSLTPGQHHVKVVATAHGAPVEGDTDLDVAIKSQGDVTLKPRGTK